MEACEKSSATEAVMRQCHGRSKKTMLDFPQNFFLKKKLKLKEKGMI